MMNEKSGAGFLENQKFRFLLHICNHQCLDKDAKMV